MPSERGAPPGPASGDLPSARAALLADRSLGGGRFAAALSAAADAWLASLFDQAVASGARASRGGSSGLALVAVGGYGRGELCPFSDLDVVLVHARRRDVAEVAERIWYPVWDANVALGHGVRTIREALDLAGGDLDSATALLDVRLVAGDAELAAELAERGRTAWARRGAAAVADLTAAAAARHERAGEVAFLLEPDLKSGRGGLRDVHTMHWAEAAGVTSGAGDGITAAEVSAAHETLLAARIELHRATGRRGDVLTLQDQDQVAHALGHADRDALMVGVADSARTVAWALDDLLATAEAASRSGRGGGRNAASERTHEVAPGVLRRGDVVELAADVDPGGEPGVALSLGAAAAAGPYRIDRASLAALGARLPVYPEPWPAGARQDLVAMLSGPGAAAAVEALDRFGLMVRILPEWEAVRCRPQRNALHRFTVDRHLVEAAVQAAERAGRVERPDLLVLGAFLHDIGKGWPGDHTDVGVELIAAVAARMGFDGSDVEVLCALCRHHLLLPSVATRRDLDDEATVSSVASAVGSVAMLDLLHALTEADALATGPAAWSTWKAELVDELVSRCRVVLTGGSANEARRDAFPTPGEVAALRAARPMVAAEGDRLSVVARDRPGLLSRVAGVLTVHGLDVLSAGALSSDEGWALQHFRVSRSATTVVAGIDWAPVTADVERALSGRLAVEARVAARARRYRPRQWAAGEVAPKVTFDDDASSSATVLEVTAPDGIGALYRITRALAELELDVRVAKVETLGGVAVDAFYVLDSDGRRVVDPAHRREIERAVLHALDPS